MKVEIFRITSFVLSVTTLISANTLIFLPVGYNLNYCYMHTAASVYTVTLTEYYISIIAIQLKLLLGKINNNRC